MMKRIIQLAVLFALGTLMMGIASASPILVSATGSFEDPNEVFEAQFIYDPATMGELLTIQTYGYGGSSNAPGGTNANGVVIAAGGFDPMIALYSGAIGGGGALIDTNDDQDSSPTDLPCGPGSGALSDGNCFDSRLFFNNLASGTYTVALSVFSNAPPSTENGAYPGTGSFDDRTGDFAIDVVATPEPITSMLLGAGLLAVTLLARCKRKHQAVRRQSDNFFLDPPIPPYYT
jgi:hypothetical protein